MVVKAAAIAKNNEFANQHRKGCLAVFVGAAAGIGESTLDRLTTMLDNSTFYVLGRNPEQLADQLARLKATAPLRGNKIVFIESQVSLIKDIDVACVQILAAESHVDYICMSPGGMPFGGIDSVVNHTTVCTSLAFDYLADHDADNDIIFMHATPGFVSTDTPRKTRPTADSGIAWWAFMSAMQIISGWIIYYFGMNVKESGERHCYHLTSDMSQPGSQQIDRLSVVQPPNKVLKKYQDQGLSAEVWEHTQRVWEKALASADLAEA